MSGAVHTLCKKRIVGGAVKKAVLLMMADYASPNGEGIWASKTTMAAQLELSRRSVQLAIKEMIEAGLVREVGSRGRSNGYTVEYAINLRAVAALPTVKDDEDMAIDFACERGSHAKEVHMTCERGSQQSAKEVHTNLQTTSCSSSRQPAAPEIDLFGEVLAAVGLTGGKLPTHWMPPASIVHIERWRSDLGLTSEQIIECARQSRANYETPPNGPKALDGAMQRYAATLNAAPLSIPQGRAQSAPPSQPKRNYSLAQWGIPD